MKTEPAMNKPNKLTLTKTTLKNLHVRSGVRTGTSISTPSHGSLGSQNALCLKT
jgi:hypothetical protein